MKQTNPKLKVELQSLDVVLEAAAVLALAVLIALPLLHWNDLPETIPTHFNSKGEADDFGSKATLWVLPGIGLAFWVGFTLLNRFPHIFNFPVKITPENAGYQYQLAVRMMRAVKFIVLAMFGYMVFASIQVAKASEGNSMNLGIFFLVFHLPMLAVIVFYFVQAQKNKPSA